MARQLDGKWALVTGSSRGIGRQVAQGLAGHGCNVVVHGRTPGSTVPTASLLADSGVDICSVAGDLSGTDGVKSVIDGVHAGPGHIDILYNNAAIMNPWQNILEISEAGWLDVLRVNLLSIIALCNALVPAMRARGYGRIINLVSGISDTPDLSPYGVSKAAVRMYTQDLAAELRDSNVLVNNLDPDWLRTDMGGPDASYPVESVLPGALVPALLPDQGASGQTFFAQDYRD